MKKVNRPQAYRIRRILELIRSRMKGDRLISAANLAVELDVSWRTVIRDLEFLRDDEGAPIEYDSSKKGYYLTDTSWHLKPVSLHQGEVFAFSVASRMLQPFRGTPLEMDLESLFNKIAHSLEGTVTLSTDALTDHISIISDDYVPLNRNIWLKLAGCIDRRETIRIKYHKFSGEQKTYELSPFHMAAYHGNWYLLAFLKGNGTPQTFTLSRIHSLAKAGFAWTVPDGFDLSTRLQSAFGMSFGEKEITAKLHFSKNVATYIAERQWHPSQKMSKRRDGSLVLEITTRGWKELVRWILSWQPDVHVLQPKSLRDRVNEKMKAGLKAK